jgi:Flp pilus assembly protein TadG
MRKRIASSNRSGTTLLETAIVITGLLMFLFAIFEYGRFLMVYHLITNAAREGARLAVSGQNAAPNATTATIQNTVTSYLAGQPLSNLNIQVYKADPSTGANIDTWTNAGFGDYVAVSVTGNYSSFLPTFGTIPNGVSLQGTSMMMCESQ